MSNHDEHNDDHELSPEERQRQYDTNEGLAKVPDDTILIGIHVPMPGLVIPEGIPEPIARAITMSMSVHEPTWAQVKEMTVAGLKDVITGIEEIEVKVADGRTAAAFQHLAETIDFASNWVLNMIGSMHQFEHEYDERVKTLGTVDTSKLDGDLGELLRDLPPLPSQAAGR